VKHLKQEFLQPALSNLVQKVKQALQQVEKIKQKKEDSSSRFFDSFFLFTKQATKQSLVLPLKKIKNKAIIITATTILHTQTTHLKCHFIKFPPFHQTKKTLKNNIKCTLSSI